MGLGVGRSNLKTFGTLTHPIETACHANTICIITGRSSISIQMLAGNRLLEYENVP